MRQPSSRSRSRSRSVIEFPDADSRDAQLHNVTDAQARLRQAEAMMEQARAWHRIADVAGRAVTTFKPAIDTVHGFGKRLDRLCTWLTGKWPWMALAAYLVLRRTVDAAPDEAPKLINAMVSFFKAFGI